MKICKGWSKNAHRYLGKTVVTGKPSPSRTVAYCGNDGHAVRYKAELMHEDGSSLVVELTSDDLLGLVLAAPAVAAMEALNEQCITFPQWLQATKSILASPAGGRPIQQ